MGSAVQNIANGVRNSVSNPGQAINNFANGTMGPMGLAGGFVNTLQPGAGNWLNQRTGGMAMPFANGGMFNPNIQQPQAPGVDPGVAQMLHQEQQQATSFRQNMPQMEQSAYQNLAQKTNQQMGANLNSIKQNSNSRGLLYGGVNAGLQGQERANTAVNLAQGREQINDQYETAANQMDQAAMGYGQMVQQSQQAIQDSIYNQALTNMMNQNQSFGSLMGAGGMAAGMALGGMR